MVREQRWLNTSLDAQATRKNHRIAAAARKLNWVYWRWRKNPKRWDALFDRRMDELDEAIKDPADRL